MRDDVRDATHGVCLPPVRERGAWRPAVLPPAAIVSHDDMMLAARRSGKSHLKARLRAPDQERRAAAGGDYVVAEVMPKCRTGVSLWSMLPPSYCELSESFGPMQDAMYD